MNKLFAAALDLQTFCRGHGWRFCFIDDIAVQRWGEPRFTKGADLTLLSGFGGEEKYIDLLLAEYQARRSDLREFALRQRVLLLQHPNGIPLDVALGALPFEENSVGRASLWQTQSGDDLVTCSAEDLIVHKCFASPPLDWGNVERVVTRQGRKINVEQICAELCPLVELKEEPEIWSGSRRYWTTISIDGDKHFWGPFRRWHAAPSIVDNKERPNRSSQVLYQTIKVSANREAGAFGMPRLKAIP